MFGVIINEQHNSTTNSTELTVPNMYAFPGGETGFFAIGTYFKYRFLSSGVAGLVARLWWMVALVFYAVQSRNIYNVYTTGSATQTKLGSKSPESAELGQVDRSKGQVGGVVNVNGRDVNVSVDTKTATSVASKAYSSGAAGYF